MEILWDKNKQEWRKITLDEKTTSRLMKLTKEDMANTLVNALLEADIAKKETIELQKKLGLAEAYVEQGRVMIEAIMERWHEYDV